MKREQRSLFGEILDWLLAPLLLLWPISVGLTWLVAQDISNRPFDVELEAATRTLSARIEPDRRQPGIYHLAPPAVEKLTEGKLQERRYQLVAYTHKLLEGDASLPRIFDEETLSPGELQFRDASIRGVPVRIAYMRAQLPGLPAEQQPLVQVAETVSNRARLASEIIKGVVLPQLVILPLAVLLVWLALARGIKPLNELQQRIRSRDSNDLRPFNEFEAPEEVSPLVLAINDLLTRLDQSITTQKRFLANAAHQLKTPLAGLRTQAELAQREIEEGQGDPTALKKSLQHIARSSQRAAHMVNQLLMMAQAEDREHAARQQPVNLTRLARDAVKDFVPRALDKHIDLGFEPQDDGDEPASMLVRGQPVLISEMIRNLVDNALQYTPAGGRVTVRVAHEEAGRIVTLEVEDSGPGIPVPERELVFHPFYRALGTNVDGSGLGLAIVKQVVQDHEAEITIEDAGVPLLRGDVLAEGSPQGPGARFTVRFSALHADHADPPGATLLLRGEETA